ncbi:hypothetical protein ccbrp13_28170 [Ktedonobacteria bacterium brp13]|nr:hypothetical protein ccbrp13_28170 [Ktedonobacteria bacterium brp13]
MRLDEHQREIQQLVADRDTLRTQLESERQDREAFQQAIRQEMTAALARQDQERSQLQHDLQREIQAAEQRQVAAMQNAKQAENEANKAQEHSHDTGNA